MGVSVLFLSTALVAFLIAGYRIVLRARGRRKPTDIPLMVIAIAFGLALVFLAPAVQTVESALVPSLGRLLSNVCTLIAAFGILHLMLYVRYPTELVRAKVRIRLITLLIAVGIMVVMFFVSSPPTGIGVFTGLYRSQPTLAVYTLTYSIYFGAATVDLATLAVRSIRSTRTWLRLGMILTAVGFLLMAGYLIEKVISIVNELVTGSIAEPYCSSAFATVHCTFAVGMPALGVLAIILGAAFPTLGPRLEHILRAVGRWRSYRRLQPLWEVVHEALPGIALAAPDLPPSTPAPGEFSQRLYRRVIAIRDALLALQPYRDPADTREHRDQAITAGLAEPHRAAAIEAADIRTALHRRQQDALPYTGEMNATTQHHDLTSELRWLTHVADALVRDELRRTQHVDADAETAPSS